jgi:hypothetical protein
MSSQGNRAMEGRNLEAGKLIYDTYIEPLFENQA